MFLGFFLYKKKTCFPLRKGHFLFIFSVFLSFSLGLFGPPSFSVSFSLSLSFLLFFLYSFLSLFLLSFGSLFWSLSLFFFLLWFSFMKGTTSKYSIASFFFINIFSFFIFLPFFVSSSFFLSLLFPDFKLCFLFNIKVFDFQTNNLKKTHFLVKRGVATKRFFFINLCFGKCQKLSFFWPFFGNFWLMFKKHYKNRYFSTFLKAKN